MRKKMLCFILSGMITTGVISSMPGQLASAETLECTATNDLEAVDIDKIKSILQEQGIEEEIQKKLIEKKINGELWDAENPEKIKDVPESFYVMDLTKPYERKVYTFEDGSIIELTHGNSNARAIISNSYTQKYENEKIVASYGGVLRATIYVNCEWPKGGRARIYNFSDSNIYTWNVGGSVTTTPMSVVKTYPDTYGPALATGKVAVYNSGYLGKQSDFRAELSVYASYGMISFQLVKM